MATIENLDKTKVETYCELGVVDFKNNKKTVHQEIRGDDAYDHFALALYFKQILQANKAMHMSHVTLNDIPRKEKVLFIYELFNYFNFDLTYFEIGTTLFEFIDGIELVNKLTGNNKDLTQNIRYRGVEISDLLKQAAIRLHPDYDIKHFDQISEIDQIDVYYDRIVSSYCFQNAKQLANVMNKAKVSFANLFLSRTISFDVMNDVGKIQTYFSIPSLVKQLNKPLFYLFGRESDYKIEGFFLNCKEEELPVIIQQFESNIFLHEFMNEKKINVVNVSTFIDQDKEKISQLYNKHIRETFEERLKDYESAC